MSEDFPKTLLELERRFSCEDTCAEYLAALRWPGGWMCPRCSGTDAWSVRRNRWLCGYCRHEMSVTAGTVFQDSHLARTIWFRAMWQITSQKNGISALGMQPKPSWQKDTGCIRRTVADVAADADPNTGASVYDTVRDQGQTGWFQVGGTSLSSPLTASVYALAGNESSTVDGSYPYAHTSSLHDVTSGSNGSCGGSYLCTGVVGYDGPTGNGTPNGTTAF
jgi:Transposase zinc-ribbon domain